MEKYAVGLMSGTSLDGIDGALVKIQGVGVSTKLELLNFINERIPANIKEEISNCCLKEKSNVELICSLNFKLGYLFSQIVKKLCKDANFPQDKLDFIGCHGQTIYHIPRGNGEVAKSTLQIGEPAVITYETGVTVVSNFRTMDMAAGGQGAPLVPYTEYLLYKCKKNRVLQNIGGIGNVTVIPANCNLQEIFAFDTGPGNMVIDEVVRNLKGLPYDRDGNFAKDGTVHQGLLEELLAMPYINMEPPKTTGRELFGKEFTKKILSRNKNILPVDFVATVTAFTAHSIVKNYRKFIFPKVKIEEVIVGGGGSYNKTLISMIRQLLPECKVMIQEDLGYSSDAKEAIAFAILANETLNGIEGNVIGATGAKERVVLGNITPGKNFFKGK